MTQIPHSSSTAATRLLWHLRGRRGARQQTTQIPHFTDASPLLQCHKAIAIGRHSRRVYSHFVYCGCRTTVVRLPKLAVVGRI